MGHEKSCWNPGGPPSKAKYVIATDSEEVPWGKGEKDPWMGSEIESETINLQAVRAGVYTGDGVPFVEWTSELLYVARLKYSSTGAVGKPSLNWAISYM